jgi:hypothetical protein
MVKKWGWMVGVVIVMGITGWLVGRGRNFPKPTVNRAVEYQSYQNKKGGFKIMIPKGWRGLEASDEGKFVARIVFRRTTLSEAVGNMGEIDITVVASPSVSQPFSTSGEFEDWRAIPDQAATGTGTIKLKNEEVAGIQAVRLAEVDMVPEDIRQSWWSVTTWFIKGGINYYVNMMGNGSLTEAELGPFELILASFKWL